VRRHRCLRQHVFEHQGEAVGESVQRCNARLLLHDVHIKAKDGSPRPRLLLLCQVAAAWAALLLGLGEYGGQPCYKFLA
jgi:hypothetical protein